MPRRLAVCLLLLALTDLSTTGRLFLHVADGCGASCAVCLCKRDAAATRFRSPCPCCKPHPGVQGPVNDVGPAVLPGPRVSAPIPPASGAVPVRAGRHESFTPSVPHPPPRTSALA